MGGLASRERGLDARGGGDIQERNPIAPTAESIAAGIALYAANCQSLPRRNRRRARPAARDLITRVPPRPDRVPFGFVRDCIPDTGMAGFSVMRKAQVGRSEILKIPLILILTNRRGNGGGQRSIWERGRPRPQRG